MDYTIREFRRSDTADLARSANHAEIAMYLKDAFPQPYLFTDAAKFVQEAVEGRAPAEIRRAICADDTVIGCITLVRGDDIYSRSAELGYFIAPAYRGRGITAEAVGQLCREALQNTDINRIYATPYAHNRASIRVLEKAGFAREGQHKNGAYKNGRPVDLVIYALTADERDD